jgi:dimethylhistidine N-methyltransferase
VNTAIAAEGTADLTARFAVEVREGLRRQGQKTLPSKYLYDALGSALFDAITALPEYGLTRAEERILQRRAKEIVNYVPRPALVSELGSGNGRKTRWILNALCAREPLSYYPIEISRAALASCESELRDIEAVSVVGVEREYLDGLREVAAVRPRDSHLLVLFLGSTIGNFDRGADARFLSGVRRFLRAGDSLLLGTDMLKAEERMIAAYDDPLGVTAAFNLNLLVRINRELGADFDPRAFAHEARFNSDTSSIEMHIRSRRKQTVYFRRDGYFVTFEEGETIWTEGCHKHSPESIDELAAASGFRKRAQWVDAEWPFAETLLIAS